MPSRQRYTFLHLTALQYIIRTVSELFIRSAAPGQHICLIYPRGFSTDLSCRSVGLLGVLTFLEQRDERSNNDRGEKEEEEEWVKKKITNHENYQAVERKTMPLFRTFVTRLSPFIL